MQKSFQDEELFHHHIMFQSDQLRSVQESHMVLVIQVGIVVVAGILMMMLIVVTDDVDNRRK